MPKKILALVSEPVSGEALKNAVGDDAEDAEVLVVAPALESRTAGSSTTPIRPSSGRTQVQEETVERMDGGGRGRGRRRRARPTRSWRSRTRSRPSTPTRSCSSPTRTASATGWRRAGGGRAGALRPAGAAPRDRARLTCADSPRISAANGAAPASRRYLERDAHLTRHRRRRLPRLPHLRFPPRARPPRDLRGQPRDRLAQQHQAHPRARFPVRDARHHGPLRDRRAGGLRLPHGLAGLAHRLRAAAAAHAQGRGLRHAQHARASRRSTAPAS